VCVRVCVCVCVPCGVVEFLGVVLWHIVFFSTIRLAYKGFLMLAKESVSCVCRRRTRVPRGMIFKIMRHSAAV